MQGLPEVLQHAEHVVVELGRRRRDAGHPAEHVLVVLIQQGLEPGKLFAVHPVEETGGEAAYDQVAFPGAPPEAAEPQLPAQPFERFRHRLPAGSAAIIAGTPEAGESPSVRLAPAGRGFRRRTASGISALRMRPEILFPLFAPVTSLKGVGPRTAKLLESVAGPQVLDLLWHLPGGMVDRRHAPRVADAIPGAVATLTVVVGAHAPSRDRHLPYRVRCRDDSGELTLVFFRGRERHLLEVLPPGEVRVVSGRIESFRGEIQMTHPDRIGSFEELESIRAIEPVYPMTAGLGPGVLRRALDTALAAAPELPEWHDAAWKERRRWPGWREALRTAHAPRTDSDLAPDGPARERLAYDELLANQLALLLVRERERRRPGRRIAGDGALRERLVAGLPFGLTPSQERAIGEICADMASRARMLRLLQGDVGSGKTLVALVAMLAAVEEGAQAALMAPTELLARQHHATIAPLLEPLGVSAVLLAGRNAGAGNASTRMAISSGAPKIAIGTHALVQKSVNFRDLALVVVDEQHRFGVHQRLALADKGAAPDVLVVTATPIPRSLLMTAYGDLTVSRLTEKPAGRRRVETRALPLSRLDDVTARLGEAVAEGTRAYWVCPLVESSEKTDLAAATERHAALAARFGARVGLLHGRLDAARKEAVMAEFAAGAIDILVATTVIEVGIDVPEAGIMVIEHAERFGLAQLHQLRGRVGRGEAGSSCLLLYGPSPGRAAEARLRALREIDDGFVIAEKDLALRGAGEMLGSRQSGLPRFRVADPAAHGDLVAAARDDARLILERDPDLGSGRGEALRVLLGLFERDAVVKNVLSG